ncbi:3-hydroxybutyrate dehydrogenase [Rhodobacteraceae bacterium 2CG4]|uniref:3-hydroxybutyrate dehydrogenase n=1 Tax=Halovulum marinum TaxID=2662447 RepID=A0A6L5YXP7_9RHOB|nr:3-hydroxybutyrate dehydrogenase [Halovulum marinum]MSU88454.1 3-hydroxybutyrate dehydrogenase [Halovulum marinum]
MQEHVLKSRTADAAATERPLRGRSAIVTGSTSGIGLGIARALAAKGVNVMLNGFGEADAVEALRSGMVKDHGVAVAYAPADMARPGEIAAMVEDCARTFGQVDILVNNAGVFHVEPVESMPPAHWDTTLSINLTAAYQAVRAALPGMKARGWGRIINIASALGVVGAPNAAAYAASKHGVVGLTRAVALEVADQGITVNAICPGYVLTPLIRHEIGETAKLRGVSEEQVKTDFLSATQPTGRFVETGEIGALAAFLCSADAASITGAALPIDGGWTAR